MVSDISCKIGVPNWQKTLIDSGKVDLIAELSDAPFHVLCPNQFAQTLSAWHTTAKEVGIRFGIRFGKKANKSAHFSREIALSALRGFDSGIDVASVEEFQAALAAGVPGNKLIITGATPSRDLIHLALCHDATLTISNEVDSRIIAQFVDETDTQNQLRVLLRIANQNPSTRFGMSIDNALSLTTRLSQGHARIEITGLSFHCNGYDLHERVYMSHLAIDTLLKMRSLFPKAGTISIGGGFPTSSVEYGVWRNLQSRLTNEMFIDLEKPKDQYPFGSPLPGQHSLEFIANQHRPLTRRNAEYARPNSDSMTQRAHRHNIKILAEPGRSLCQFAGASFFPVLSCHALPNAARTVTVVRGTSLSLSEQWFNSEYYPDPYLVRNGVIVNSGVTTATAVSGSTCLDSDYLSKRMIQLPDRPHPGDFLVYPDTAGYQMDSNESCFHGYRIPQKYAFNPVTMAITEDR